MPLPMSLYSDVIKHDFHTIIVERNAHVVRDRGDGGQREERRRVEGKLYDVLLAAAEQLCLGDHAILLLSHSTATKTFAYVHNTTTNNYR